MVVVTIPTVVLDKNGERRQSDGPFQVLVDNLDWKNTMLLEFQGTIQMDGTAWNDQVLGNLSLVDGSNKAVLIIGNHRLEGKVVKLDRPMLLIRKQQRPTAEDLISPTPASQPLTSQSSSLLLPKDGSGMDMDLDPEEEALLRRAVEMDRDISHSNNNNNNQHQSPSESTAVDAGTISSAPKSSSGMDIDSATNTVGNGESDARSQQAEFKTIAYETVAVIRQKILFNSMPQAIIKEERRGLTTIKRGV
ncbi:hypothetical protein BGW42_001431 [Actinomortierella wolfii]|nr:hypothetical protein BGW42_001431 [Actinomortierella wolfii]